MTYTKEDCKRDTLEHIHKVNSRMWQVRLELENRAGKHDLSKLEEPELSIFTEYTPRLAKLTYGSDEYKESLKGLGVALEHHYKHNSHHPEHHPNGINDMSLLDVVEMFCDWKASSERHENGDIRKSLEINKERFNISNQLYDILSNTIDELDWSEDE